MSHFTVRRGLSPVLQLELIEEFVMHYVNLGRSGLKVSRLALGCVSFGVEARAWRVDEAASRAVIRRALDLGITLFDTADMYGKGESEIALGRAIADFVPRDEIVIATKLFYPMRPDANGRGLSRKAILAGIDASLSRLGTDHVDLYQIHRWDPETPIEETMEALHDVVKMGKARYIGASSMFAWQLLKAQYVARQSGWTSFVSVQPHYNLLNRGGRAEMIPMCLSEGIGVLPGVRSRGGGSLAHGTRRRAPIASATIGPPRCSTRRRRRPTSGSSRRSAPSLGRGGFRRPRWRSPGCSRNRG